MATYQNNEIQNEVGRYLESPRLDLRRQGGLVNPGQTISIILSNAAMSFLLRPDSIYYLAQLIINSTLVQVKQEADLLEDMLVEIDNLQNVGLPITGTQYLANASTALQSLESSSQPENSPEYYQFTKNMEKFSEGLRDNTIKGQAVIRTRQKAVELLTADFSRLLGIHDTVLGKLGGLAGLLDSFQSLNLKNLVATATFSTIRQSIENLQDELDASSNPNRSREILLKILSMKSVVSTVAESPGTQSLKLRGPNNPYPTNTVYMATADGPGEPATLLSRSGPWSLPLQSTVDLSVVVDGGASQVVPIGGFLGPVLNGRTAAPFSITTGTQDIHVIVDPDQYSETPTSVTTSTFRVSSAKKIGFKHLGAFVSFPTSADPAPRVITTLGTVATFTPSSWTPATGILVAPSPIFISNVPGFIIQDAGSNQFEVVEVINSTTVRIDRRGITANMASATWLGYDPSISRTIVTVSPAYGAPPTGAVTIGPCIKTARITVGSATAAAVAADLNNEAVSGAAHVNHVGARLGRHVEARVSTADPSKVTLRCRSRLGAHIQIASTFAYMNPASSSSFALLGGSAHLDLGFRVGEVESDSLVSSDELADLLNKNTTGLTASVQTEQLAGGRLATTKNTANVSDPDANFTAAGVTAGCLLYILSGEEAGQYVIQTVGTTTLAVRDYTFGSSEVGLSYVVESNKVRAASDNTGTNSSIKITGSSDFGFSTETQYGSCPYLKIQDRHRSGANLSGMLVGDLVRIPGLDDRSVVSVLGNAHQLELDPVLPSNVVDSQFSVVSGGHDRLVFLLGKIETFMTSDNLLKLHGFDQSLVELDSALNLAKASGQTYTSNLGRVRQIVSDLLGILVSTYPRSDEYEADPVPASMVLVDILSQYSASVVEDLNDLLDSLIDRKYDRAYDLLLTGDFQGFFSITEETASYAGYLLSASRQVVNDLPSNRQSENGVVEDSEGGSLQITDDVDADRNLTDTAWVDYEEPGI